MAAAITFEPPGPGSWMLDTTHHGRRPLTGYAAELMLDAFGDGMAAMLARYGLPLAGFETRLVNGCFYLRPRPVGEGDTPRPAPPTPVMWLIARLHPELRRRNRTARQAWAERRWRTDVDTWFDVERPALVEELRTLQAVDLADLDDAALLQHLQQATDRFHRAARQGFELHGGDIIPIGDYLAHCEQWGVDTAAAAALLRGSSPASVETARILAPVARAVGAAAAPPVSVADVRALDPDADRAVGEWLADHGWRLLTSDDLDAPTLAERSELQLRALLASTLVDVEAPDPGAVRDQVPPEHRSLFDELLGEARYGMRLRDDAVGVGWNWPAGLVRRALLEVGRRAGLHDPAHAVELDREEVALLLRGEGPGADELAARARHRLEVEAADPPATLGDGDEGPPPVEAFPAPMARATAAVLATIAAMQGADHDEPLRGTGVGDTSYRGRARVVTDAAAALALIEPGDVLVAPFTGPAYNSILPLIGAIVVAEGGPMSHAAIVSREFGLPAVVGARGAVELIADGAEVEVDPVIGQVRVLGG